MAAELLNFEILEACGKHSLMLGGKICVLPFSGRVLGLYPDAQHNVLWTNPKLECQDSAQKLLTSGEWTNLGGDRTWISPEIELFIKDVSRPMDSYKVPCAIDPGNYSIISQNETEIILINKMPVTFFRSKCKTSLVLQKRISLLHSPGFMLPTGVSAVGYELECTLSAPESISDNIKPAIWNLLQVPGGGKIIVPVKGRTKPVEFFGEQEYENNGECIHAVIPAISGYKFGLRPECSLGIMIYLKLSTPRPFVIIRQFNINPQGGYFDVPYSMPQQPGCVQQVYIDDGAYGGFGEMEHHSSVIEFGKNNRTIDKCITWAFTGSIECLQKEVRKLIDYYSK